MKNRSANMIRDISIALLCVSGIINAQSDSSAASFFPSRVGDSWHYQYTKNLGYITTITHDSSTDGTRFIFLDSSSVPSFKIDTSWNVYSKSSCLYKLVAKSKEVWHVEMAIKARVDNIYWDYVLGRLTQIKQIGYYSEIDTGFNLWFYDRYLAAGFGWYLERTDATYEPSLELYGCVIDGKTSGSMLTVENQSEYPMASSYRLFPSFPNPFNASTIISYQLSKDAAVNISVYDQLGRKIETLINEDKPKGYYQIRYQPFGNSSGVYLLRMSAGGFSQTITMVYLK